MCECENEYPGGKEQRDAWLTVIDHGGWSEFHQKHGNHYMYGYHHALYMKLGREYRKRWK